MPLKLLTKFLAQVQSHCKMNLPKLVVSLSHGIENVT